MSYGPTTYDAAPPKPGELAPPIFEVQYLQAYNYVFENPNWLTNLAFLVVVTIVSGFVPVVGPFVGQFVILGYSFDIVESLVRTGGRRYPDFSFERLGDYILRGIWPFLASLISSLVLLPVVAGVAVSIIALWGGFSGGNANGLGNTDPSPILIAISVLLGLSGMLLGWAFSIFVVMPMTIRAGLSQDLGQAFQFAAVVDFGKKVWFEAILLGLFIGFSAMGLVIVGILLLCVGYYFALVLVSLAQANVMYQLYALYLSRGGEPIPFKAPPVLAAGQFGPPSAGVDPLVGNPFAQQVLPPPKPFFPSQTPPDPNRPS